MSLLTFLIEAAKARPDTVFVANRHCSLTYNDVLGRAQVLADQIRSRSSSPRPCILQASELSATVGVFACLMAKKPFILVNPQSPADRLRYYEHDSGADLALDEPELDTESTRELAGSLLLRGISAPDEPWKTVGDPDSVAALIYTSGSTGQPKAVVCPSSAMEFASDAIARALGYRPYDVILTALPLFFDFGLYQVFLAARVGASVYFATALESGFGLGEALRRTQATVLPMVPPAADKLARLARKGLERQSVRMVTTTGAALSAETRSTLRDAWGGGVDVRVMYGLTECKRVAIMPPFESFVRTDASGLALPGTQISIRPFGSESILAPGDVGEICAEGPHVMAGYHNQPELTAKRYAHSALGVVLRTGDRGYLDDDGYLHCLGRDDSQFKVQGFRVSADEVTAAARSIGGVESAAVVTPAKGVPYALFYEGDTPQENVLAELGSRLEPYAVPTRVTKVSNLPITDNGKINLQELREVATHG